MSTLETPEEPMESVRLKHIPKVPDAAFVSNGKDSDFNDLRVFVTKTFVSICMITELVV